MTNQWRNDGTDDESHVYDRGSAVGDDGGRYRYGRIPPTRRPLAAMVLGVAGIIVIAGGLIINGLTETSVHWWLLLAIAGFVLVILSVYLWIRLSD